MNSHTETTEQKQAITSPVSENHQTSDPFDALVNDALSQTKDAVESNQAGVHALDIERIAKLNERGLIPKWKSLIDNNKITFRTIHDIILTLNFENKENKEDKAKRNLKQKGRNKKNLSRITMSLTVFTKHLQDEYGFKKYTKRIKQ